MATDLTISVEDRPGSMASVGEALGAAGINIEGLCGLGFEGRGMIHICVEDAAGARQALDAAGIKVEGEADAVLGAPVAGAERPGTMGAMARRVADAGINVRAAYLATDSRVVMVTDDNAKLMELIASM
ncbi:MAG: ACT domain-containing protein [Planctomycetaceae bacterium]